MKRAVHRRKSSLASVSGYFCLLLLLFLSSSCTTHRSARNTLPPGLTMNENAGRGYPLLVMVRVEGGKPLPMVLDTGMPITFLDQSLAPKFGKSIRTSTLWTFGTPHQISYYSAPRLYLGNTLLRSSNLVCAVDCQDFGLPQGVIIKGIIGMDILRHHCLQLDFQNEKIQFIAPAHASKTGWGEVFPLKPLSDGCFITPKNLTGTDDTGSIIDTGLSGDGWLTAESYEHWTNHISPPVQGEARSPKGFLGKETYPDLDLSRVNGKTNEVDFHLKYNGIGLGVLARHLVTLDFPNQTMYLKRFTDWRPMSLELKTRAEPVAAAAAMYLKELEQAEKLPGWQRKDKGGLVAYHFEQQNLKTVILDAKKKDDSSSYHYTLTRKSDQSPWTLKRAWKTDENGNVVEEFKVP